MYLKLGDFVIQNEDENKPYLFIDYENAMNGKFLDILGNYLDRLKNGEIDILVNPLGNEDVILPTYNAFIWFIRSHYLRRTNDQKTFIIRGAQGAGKSTLALKILSYTYVIHDVIKRDGEIDRVALLKNLIFALYMMVIDPLQLDYLIDVLKIYGLRLPAIMIDDGQLFFSSSSFLLDRELYVRTGQLFTVMRPVIMSTLITIPLDDTSLNKAIRESEGAILVTVERDEKSREITETLQKLGKDPTLYAEWRTYKRAMMKKSRFKRFQIQYIEIINGERQKTATSRGVHNVLLPDQVYAIYNKLRIEYTKIIGIEKKKKKRNEAEQTQQGP